MAAADALRLVASATMLGVVAAWLLGVWMYMRLVRRARTAGARRIVRFLIPAPAAEVTGRLVRELSMSPHFIASFTGQLESVITGVVTPAKDAAAGAPPAARIAFRLDDLGPRCRLRLRVDFSPLLEQHRVVSRLWVFMFWPAWTFVATAGAIAMFALAAPPSPWWGLGFGFGALPIVGQLAIVGRCGRIRRRLGDAVIGTAEELRSSVLA